MSNYIAAYAAKHNLPVFSRPCAECGQAFDTLEQDKSVCSPCGAARFDRQQAARRQRAKSDYWRLAGGTLASGISRL